jgi:arylsulfatase A-like enzyme
MKKMTIIAASIIVIAAVSFIVIFVSSGADKSFCRMPSKDLTRDLERIPMDEVPSRNGHYFHLKGKKQIKLNPVLTGDTAFYTYLYLESSLKNKPVSFTLEIYRDGTSRVIERLDTVKTAQPFFADMDIGENDLVLLRFKGRGTVYLGQPIFYRPYQPGEEDKQVIFIAVDTLRADHTGKKTGGQSLTPHIDAFIEDSVCLENAYAQTSWTLPSFMSLFTAQYEYHHGVGIKDPLSPRKPHLVEPLSQEFITVAYHGGKVMNGRWGFSRGFDYYKKYQQAGSLYPRGGRHLFAKAMELLENARFPNLFLFLHTYQVHAPYTPPEEFLLKLNPNPAYKKLDAVNVNQPEKTFLPVDEPLKQSLKELYQAEIFAFDAYFGEFIEKLKASGRYDNTMIVLMSDHGEEFFEHGGWTHSHGLYNEQIRVPVVIKFPGGRFKNTRLDAPVGIIDLMPTILSYYGIEYEASKADGMNLMPVIESGGREKLSRDYLVSTIGTGKYFEAVPTKIALVFDRYKIIYNDPFSQADLDFFKDHAPPPDFPRFQLFDLVEDPGETRNVVETHIRLKEKMMPAILSIRKLILQVSKSRGKKELDKEVKEQLESLGYL